MSKISCLIISMQIDLEEARDFHMEGDHTKMRANLSHLRDSANKILVSSPENEPESLEPTDPD